ncbi:glycosyltransferase family 32 [Brachionus plicatilis]|uniref:Glycosyltransferase family 32 n=1 Tax=Brachionus plicatilis TaxID=10195 RepID=A0A3M7PCA1_BRAPC|nr:glycosyltransferase family 32 [Brachionus plicatilis]
MYQLLQFTEHASKKFPDFKRKNKQYGKDYEILKPNILVSNSSFEDELEMISETFCDHQNEKTELGECLKNLSKLDEKIQIKRSENRFYNPCDDCLTFEGRKMPIYHHTFWQLSDAQNSSGYKFKRRVLFLNVMSFFYSQNLCCSKYIFWKLKNFPVEIEATLVKKFSKFIKNETFEIIEFDIVKLCEKSKKLNGSIINQYPICKENREMRNFNLISLSDLVRFFVLDLYGGIYVDGDVIFLKETNLLWKQSFVYRWSYTNKINTAIIGINKYFSTHVKDFYDRIFSREKSTSAIISSLHPFSLSTNLFGRFKLKVYHSFLFDSAWLCFDGKKKRVSKETVCGFDEFNNRYLGAFSYHLHLVNCGIKRIMIFLKSCVKNQDVSEWVSFAELLQRLNFGGSKFASADIFCITIFRLITERKANYKKNYEIALNQICKH